MRLILSAPGGTYLLVSDTARLHKFERLTEIPVIFFYDICVCDFFTVQLDSRRATRFGKPIPLDVLMYALSVSKRDRMLCTDILKDMCRY